MTDMLRVFDVEVATPGAVRYVTQAAARSGKRTTAGAGEEEKQLLVERAVLVPPDAVLVFVLTANRGQAFQLPRPYKRGDHVLQLNDMSEAERHVATRVQQQQVWAQYEEE